VKKQIIVFTFSASLLFFLFVFFSCQAHTACFGDVNGDGSMTLLDFKCILQASAKICPTLCGECDPISYDINEDGLITSFDALEVYKKVIGSESILDDICPILTPETETLYGNQITIDDQRCFSAGDDLIFTISVNDAPNDVTFLYLIILYDSNRLEYKNAIFGNLIQEPHCIFINNKQIGILIISSDDAGILQEDTGSLLKLNFGVKKCEESMLVLFDFSDDIAGWTGRPGRVKVDQGNQYYQTYQLFFPEISLNSDFQTVLKKRMLF